MNKRRRPPRWLPVVIGGAAICLAILVVVIWARHVMAQKPKQLRQVPQVVQLIRPPQDAPPPPPPPPEKVEEPLPQDTPQPDQTPDAPSQPLGIDADASAGGDAFGLAARRGGADLVGTGSAIFGRYTALVKEAIQDVLGDDEAVRHGNYSLIVRIWLAQDGAVERVALVQGTGNASRDNAVVKSLNRVHRLSEPPPLEMPQPITLKVVSKG